MAAAEWPHKADIIFNPAKRVKLAICGAFLVGVFAFALNQSNIVDHFVEKREITLLAPQMAKLAAEGIPEAIAWMTLKDAAFREADKQFTALRHAAESGHPQSMFLYSGVLRFQGDAAGAESYLDQAAAMGYPAAILAKADKR